MEEKVEALEAILEPAEGKEKVVSFIDFDGRHGRKSVKRMFSGYKAHLAEDESEIVTSCDVLAGNRNEGHALPELLQKEVEKGIKAEAVVGDSLYDSCLNRERVHEAGMKAYIPFRSERKWMAKFSSHHDEDCVLWAEGKRSIGKLAQEKGTLYYFSVFDCKACSHFKKCVRRTRSE